MLKRIRFIEAFVNLATGIILENAELEIIFFPCSRIEVISFDGNKKYKVILLNLTSNI